MDIKKLERLSGIELPMEHKELVQKSIEDVWSMMMSLKDVVVDEGDVKEPIYTPTVFKQRHDVMFDAVEGVEGVKIKEGKFEAPRVLRK